jgi:hypothetical protein
LIGGAAAFGAFKVFEDRQRADGRLRLYIHINNVITEILIHHLITGQPVSHAFAKEVLAGLAGAEVDKLAETKGEDFFDRERSKHEAKKRAENLYDQHYGGQEQYDP